MLAPRKLQPGDPIGILSTSSPTDSETIGIMTRYFEGMGYTVRVAPHTLARLGHLAGDARTRAADFNAMLCDPSIRMIVTANGGSGAEHLVPLVDYAAIIADPKFIVGLSNPSILLNAITAKTGVPTIHGPNGVDFGSTGLPSFTAENFWPIVRGDLAMPYAFPVHDEIRVLRGGAAVEGPLYGGHIRTVQRLIGTPWAPDWEDAILFLEEYEVGYADFDKSLTHFKLAGILDKVKGLIIGQPVISQSVDAETLDEIVLRICAGGSYPVVSNMRIGHTEEKLTVPIGCRVRLDPTNHSFALLESPAG